MLTIIRRFNYAFYVLAGARVTCHFRSVSFINDYGLYDASMYIFLDGRVDRKKGLKHFGNLKPTETLNLHFAKTRASVTLGTPRAMVMQKLFERKRKVASAIRHSWARRCSKRHVRQRIYIRS